MDYEKKYKEAFEIAKEALKTDMHESGANAIRRIFPELQESEDERIRKWLYDYIGRVGRTWGKQPFNYEQILVWLEKQQEQKTKVECDIAQPVEQDGTAELDYGICGDFVPGKLAAALRRHGWYLGYVGENQQMLEARKEEFMRNWPADRCSLTQEQKPAEWSEEDENRFRNLIYLVENSNEGKGTKEGFVKFINRLKSLRPSWKPRARSRCVFY